MKKIGKHLILNSVILSSPILVLSTISCNKTTTNDADNMNLDKEANSLVFSMNNFDEMPEDQSLSRSDVEGKIIWDLENDNKSIVKIEDFELKGEKEEQEIIIRFYVQDLQRKHKSLLHEKRFHVGRERKRKNHFRRRDHRNPGENNNNNEQPSPITPSTDSPNPSINNDNSRNNTNAPEITNNDDKSKDVHDLNLKKIRIGNWNVLNFSLTENNSDLVKNVKIKAIAYLIKHLNIDVQGIIELDNEEAVKELTNYLNQIQPEAKWEYIINDWNDNGKNPLLEANSKQHEYAAVIYKSSKLNSKKFINNKFGLSYDNSNFENHFRQGKKYGYVRPPFGVLLETKGKTKNDFTFVIDHFDSPGKNDKIGESSISRVNGNKLAKSVGDQEADEAYNLYNMMNWFDNHDAENDDLIFMGDTNIPAHTTNHLFEPALNNGYISLISDDVNTSLGTKFGAYASAYDKIFYKGDLAFENPSTYNLYDIADDGVIPHIHGFAAWKKYVESYNKTYSNPASYIKSSIADHNPIYFDLILNPNDPK
ncbi:endonuclease/exonuclease/phosphatase family protein [Mycoplasmopsis iners]|uniref:endonuclease/exonuclease/phosphatase family protein n=1 Tax=Mycoplasmopsis iners TaxID=76630 RepID=UPI000690A13C|nr:endonuclease/exonuclease/phosphatase family protein [Mycoplasmopsis iners]